MAALSFHQGTLTALPGGCLSAPLNEGRHSVHPLSSCKGGRARGAQETHLSSGTRVSSPRLPPLQMCRQLLHHKSIHPVCLHPTTRLQRARLAEQGDGNKLALPPSLPFPQQPHAGEHRRGASLDAQRAACWLPDVRRETLGLQQETLHHSKDPRVHLSLRTIHVRSDQAVPCGS